MPSFFRANLIEPSTVTPGTTRTQLFTGYQDLDAFWVLVAVRTMGTATYVAIGNQNSQENRLLGAGDFQIFDVPEGFVFNAAQLYAKADVAGQVVLEISGMFPAIAGNQAIRSGQP
jgi:hypothetical protein